MKRHIPQRTCVACRQATGKWELIRLVLTSEGSVEVDVIGRIAGRGAYLCPTRMCWENGLKGGQLGRALRTDLTEDDRRRLSNRVEELLREREQ